MTIAIDARQYTTSTGRYVFRLVQYLEKLDTVNDYLILLKPQDMKVYKFSNPRFKKVVCPYREFGVMEQLGFLKQLNGLGADLVHFTMVQQPIAYRGPVVTTIHDLTTLRYTNPSKNWLAHKFKQQVYKSVIKVAAAKSRVIMTPSKYVKADLIQFSGQTAAKIRVTYEAADPISLPALALNGLVGQRFLLYVGRPTPHKNLERLIEAFGKLRASHPDLRLVLAGMKDANYRRIEADVHGRRLSNIIFTDFVSEGQLRWLYEHCTAYVFPSLSEGFGLPGLEAMVHGAPVVASRASCLPEIYGSAAHYFDPTDTLAMADAINEVLTDKALRRRLITDGRAQAASYSWQRTAEQTLAIYRQVLAKN